MMDPETYLIACGWKQRDGLGWWTDPRGPKDSDGRGIVDFNLNAAVLIQQRRDAEVRG